MRRITSLILSILFVSTVCTLAPSTKAETTDESLASYQTAIDIVNADLGSTIYIPNENKEKVYNNIKF